MVWAVVAVAVVSAIAQNYQAKKAAGANQKELDKIKAEWDRLVPPNFDASIMDPPEYIKQLPNLPNFDMSKVTPETYKMVAKYQPDLAPLIREANPTLVKSSKEGEEGRKAQLDALRKLKSVASGGVDPEFAGALDDAARRSQIESQSREGSILQDFARRGMMGSGQELAAKLASQQGAMTENAAASRQAAIESYKNRLQALRDSASLGGQISDSDFSRQAMNAGIINSFNQRLSANAQRNADNNTGIINDAKKSNWEMGQDIANKNTTLTNDTAWKNKLRDDELKKLLYGYSMDQTEYLNNLTGKEYDSRVRERDRQDNLVSAGYNHNVNVINGKAGIGGQQIQMNTQNAQDNNASIAGAAGGATSAIMYSDEEKRRKEERDRKNKGGEY